MPPKLCRLPASLIWKVVVLPAFSSNFLFKALTQPLCGFGVFVAIFGAGDDDRSFFHTLKELLVTPFKCDVLEGDGPGLDAVFLDVEDMLLAEIVEFETCRAVHV